MRQNPVYKREMQAGSRSLRLPMILFFFNGVLFLVTLLNMYSAVAQVRSSAVMQYSSFMKMYEFVTAMEFILLLFIVPAVTAASISSERERQTLDLMLTTRLTAAQVVTGKLMGALSTMFLLILSSLPSVAVVFVYGGITWWDAAQLILCYITVAFFAGSLGICFSAVFKRSTLSTVMTYGVLIAIVAGTYFINRFVHSLSSMELSRTPAVYVFGETAARASSGGAFYLYLLNPAITFFAIIEGQVGSSRPMTRMCSQFGIENSGFIMEHWILISIILQLLIGILLIYIAIRCVEPIKGRRRKKLQNSAV